MSEFLKFLLKRQEKNNLLVFLSACIIIMLIAISILDIYTNNDTTISSTAILNEENVQYELRKNETKFREQIFQNLKTLYSDKSFDLIDSISKNHKDSNTIKNYIIFNKLKNGKKKYQFKSLFKFCSIIILWLQFSPYSLMFP